MPVRPDSSAAPDGAVHRAGEPDGEALDAAHQRRMRVRLAEQVDVVALRAVAHDAEAAARRVVESGFQPSEDVPVPETRDVAARAEGDVDRHARVVHGARPVRDAGVAGAWPAGTGSSAAVSGRSGQHELSSSGPHLIRAII